MQNFDYAIISYVACQEVHVHDHHMYKSYMFLLKTQFIHIIKLIHRYL